MTVTILSAFAPVFALIALGYGVRATGFMARPAWAGVNALNHRLLLPAFLFALLARTDFAAPDALPIVVASATGSFAMLAIAIGTALVLRLDTGPRTALICVSVLWNVVLTLALGQRLLGPESAAAGAAVVTSGAVIGTACAVAAFACASAGSLSSAAVRIVRDPVLIACTAGLAASALGLARLAPGVLAPLDMLGAGAMAVILLSMGAGLDFSALKGRVVALAAAAALRSLAGPCVFIALALVFGLRGDALVFMALAGAAPGAAFTYAVAADFRAETGLVAGMLTLTVLTSALTLPVAAGFALGL